MLTQCSIAAGADIEADFEDTPLLGQQEWKEPSQFDAITCMFAIHYFFESEKAIKTFLHNVSINLKEGDRATCSVTLMTQCKRAHTVIFVVVNFSDSMPCLVYHILLGILNNSAVLLNLCTCCCLLVS